MNSQRRNPVHQKSDNFPSTGTVPVLQRRGTHRRTLPSEHTAVKTWSWPPTGPGAKDMCCMCPQSSPAICAVEGLEFRVWGLESGVCCSFKQSTLAMRAVQSLVCCREPWPTTAPRANSLLTLNPKPWPTTAPRVNSLRVFRPLRWFWYTYTHKGLHHQMDSDFRRAQWRGFPPERRVRHLVLCRSTGLRCR